MSISSSFKRVAAVAVLFVAPIAAFADGTLSNLQTLATNSLSILNTVITIVFVLAILVFGWGVVKYVSSAGNPEKEKEARSFLWWGVIGIFVLASIFGLVKFIGSATGIDQNIGNITIPKVIPNQ